MLHSVGPITEIHALMVSGQSERRRVHCSNSRHASACRLVLKVRPLLGVIISVTRVVVVIIMLGSITMVERAITAARNPVERSVSPPQSPVLEMLATLPSLVYAHQFD